SARKPVECALAATALNWRTPVARCAAIYSAALCGGRAFWERAVQPPFSASACRMLSRSRVLRAKRSRWVTIRKSPGSRRRITYYFTNKTANVSHKSGGGNEGGVWEVNAIGRRD